MVRLKLASVLKSTLSGELFHVSYSNSVTVRAKFFSER